MTIKFKSYICNMIIDLRSDTFTKPTPEMKAAMMAAEVGDDVFGEDPTVNMLEERVAKMFQKESSLYLPTGTMANLVATMTWCGTRGSGIIYEANNITMLY